MELGAEAAWTPADLFEAGVIDSMLVPACEMLKQMDGVGFYNENGIDPRIQPSPTTDTVSAPAPNVEYW